MQLPQKDSVAQWLCEFDFVNRLASGEFIASVDGVVQSGGLQLAPEPPFFSGTKVFFWLSGGTPGEMATALIIVNTTMGEVLTEPATTFIRS
jgi:hypothetical protein